MLQKIHVRKLLAGLGSKFEQDQETALTTLEDFLREKAMKNAAKDADGNVVKWQKLAVTQAEFLEQYCEDYNEELHPLQKEALDKDLYKLFSDFRDSKVASVEQIFGQACGQTVQLPDETGKKVPMTVESEKDAAIIRGYFLKDHNNKFGCQGKKSAKQQIKARSAARIADLLGL